MSRTRARTLVALSLGLALAACRDSTGPGEGRPGTRLLDSRAFGEFAWLPSGQEIVFGTPVDYPSPGRPHRIEVITVPGGVRRTIATSTSNGGDILPYEFQARGAHVYFNMLNPTTAAGVFGLYRAPLAGGGTPQLLVENPSVPFAVAHDERALAWVHFDHITTRSSVVVMEIATGTRRSYALERRAFNLEWSPSGQSLLAHTDYDAYGSNFPIQRVDVSTGALDIWTPPEHGFAGAGSRAVRWEGEVPWLHLADEGHLVRYSIPTGVGDTLVSGLDPNATVDWSADFSTAALTTTDCLEWRPGESGQDCAKWESTIEQIAVPSGMSLGIFRLPGIRHVDARPSPNGEWLAYAYGACAGGCYAAGDGLYVVRVP